jgi:hypothetical protein
VSSVSLVGNFRVAFAASTRWLFSAVHRTLVARRTALVTLDRRNAGKLWRVAVLAAIGLP